MPDHTSLAPSSCQEPLRYLRGDDAAATSAASDFSPVLADRRYSVKPVVV